MNLMFYIFNISRGNNEWSRALFIEGKWYEFDWGWYCDVINDDIMGSTSADPSLWDGCLESLTPVEGVLWATPEVDRDSGPYYAYMHYTWALKNLGITLPV